MRANLNAQADVWPARPIHPAQPFKFQTRRIAQFKPMAPEFNLGDQRLQAQLLDAATPRQGWILRHPESGICTKPR